MKSNVPDDAIEPQFYNKFKVHDWKNYTTDSLESAWDTFTVEQKEIIAELLQNIADEEEEWD